MAIQEGYKSNFSTLTQAFENNDVALVECTDKKTKEKVIAICALNKLDNGEIEMAPLAKMFNNNPYDELDPPE